MGRVDSGCAVRVVVVAGCTFGPGQALAVDVLTCHGIWVFGLRCLVIEGIWQTYILPWKNILTNSLLFRYNASHDNDPRQ